MLNYEIRPASDAKLPCSDELPPLLARLLSQRGIASAAEAEAFLHPGINQLYDPMRLNDMAAAVDMLRDAAARGSRICIYGDYDVDGVCASAIMRLCLAHMGADAQVYLPSRHNEGYGLNEDAVREIAAEYGLLITVDCGIASHDLIGLAKSLGLSCVVTDHHRVGELLPECPCVNPQLNDYPFTGLCGAGVAWKLACALTGMETALSWIDLAAIATVADIVPLTSENRAIVACGLKAINQSPRVGVRALMQSAHIEPGSVTAQMIAYRLSPRLNAGGRLGDARRSYALLVAEDDFSAAALADQLEQENAKRQQVEREIRDAALTQLTDYDFSAHRIIIVHAEGWNSGVIGLAASHLREQFYYPVIAMTEKDGMLTGSCRSIPGVDIFKTLCAAEDLLERFGGHSQAAGLTVKRENLDALRERLDGWLFENVPADRYIPCLEYDLDVGLDELSVAAVGALQALEPTGCQNPEPVFRTAGKLIEARKIGLQGAHLRTILSGGGTRRSGIFFNAGHLAEELSDDVDVLYTPSLNVWNGRTDVQLRISAIKNDGISAQIAAASRNEPSIQRRFLTELTYNKGIKHGIAPSITLDQLSRLYAARERGMLILCASLETAERIHERLSPAPDLYIGRMCADPRLFNAICVCPDSIAFPSALRTLVLADVPELACFFGLPNVQVLRLSLGRPIFADLPDVDQMRAVYRAAVHLTRRPVRLYSMDQLAVRIAEEAELPPFACHAALLALMDMNLIVITESPFTLRIPPVKKTDPGTSAVWRDLRDMQKM